MISLLVIVLFVGFMFLRIPVSIAIGLATIVTMVIGGYDLILVPQFMVASLQSISFLAVPFFILTANLMNGLRITRKLYDFADALVGSLPGGLAHVNVVSNVIFSTISGVAVANAAGLGALHVKEMGRAGYDRAFTCALTISSSALGPIIPPSVMMIIYALLADVSIARMFVAGFLPGLFIAICLMALIHVLMLTGRQKYPPSKTFSLRRLAETGRDGVLALVTPAIIFLGLVTGVTTPTEAGITAVVYALLLGGVYRSLSWRIVIEALRETVEATALIMYIIAISSALSYVIVAEGTALQITQLMSTLTDSPWLFLLVTNILLLIIGSLLETLPAMLIAVPMLLPTSKALGIDSVHFGLIVIFNLLIGMLTPPMGIGLYIMAAISDVPFGRIVRASGPFLLILTLSLLALTYIPEITLWLPYQVFGPDLP